MQGPGDLLGCLNPLQPREGGGGQRVLFLASSHLLSSCQNLVIRWGQEEGSQGATGAGDQGWESYSQGDEGKPGSGSVVERGRVPQGAAPQASPSGQQGDIHEGRGRQPS